MVKRGTFRPTASFWEANRIALDSLRKNKLRSFLTLLGIILATTTLIVVTALIHGMNVYIAEKVSDMGADGFRVVRMAWFGPWDPKKFYEMLKRNPEIKREEYEFVKSKAALLKDMGMMANRRGRVSYKGDSVQRVEIEGITDNIPAINNVSVAIGRNIAAEEVRRHAAVVFIGNDLRTRFFGAADPLRKTIQIEGNPYEVVGVAKALGSVFGQSLDNFVMIPIESYFKTYGSRKGIDLIAKAIDQEHLMESEDEVRMLLRAYRHLRPNQDDNFSIFASETFVSLWNRLTAAIAAETAVAARAARPYIWSGGPVSAPGDGAGADVVVCDVLPTREELTVLATIGKPVFVITSSQLPYLKAIAALTPLGLTPAADRAQDRNAALRERISERLERGEVDAELALLEPLFEKWDPAEVAAALLALSRQPLDGSNDDDVTAPADQWVKVFVNVGKKDRAGPKDLVGALIKEVGLEKGQIGRIDMRESFVLIEVAPSAAETVVRRMTGVTIKGKRVAAKVDHG